MTGSARRAIKRDLRRFGGGYMGGAYKWRRHPGRANHRARQRHRIADDHAYRVWRHVIVLRAKTRPAFTPGNTAGQSSLRRRIYCRLSRDHFFSFLSASFSFSSSLSLSVRQSRFCWFHSKSVKIKKKYSVYAWDRRRRRDCSIHESISEGGVNGVRFSDVSLIRRLCTYFSILSSGLGEKIRIYDWSQRHDSRG